MKRYRVKFERIDKNRNIPDLTITVDPRGAQPGTADYDELVADQIRPFVGQRTDLSRMADHHAVEVWMAESGRRGAGNIAGGQLGRFKVSEA